MIKLKRITLLYLLALFGMLAVRCAHSAEVINVTLRVIDEEGFPIKGAQAIIEYYRVDSTFDTKHGETDENGLFSYRSKSEHDIGFSAEKDGYYKSSGKTHPYQMKDSRAVLEGGEPIYEDQEIELVLKRIKKPVELVAYANWEMDVPARDKPLGYDVLKGDWVSPYGEGSNADIYFEYSSEYRGKFDYNGKLVMSFPNEHDGFIPFEVDYQNGSLLKSDHEAPKAGYIQSKTWEFQRQPNVMFSDAGDRTGNFNDYDEPTSYWLRLRTVADDEGNIERAIYAKIYRDIKFGGIHDKAFIKFSALYVNPEWNDRNLEFDLKRNLLKGLKYKHQPRYP